VGTGKGRIQIGFAKAKTGGKKKKGGRSNNKVLNKLGWGWVNSESFAFQGGGGNKLTGRGKVQLKSIQLGP